MDKRYYTTSQAADLLAVSADTVLKWVRQGKINSYRTPGGHARIPREVVEGLLPVSASSPAHASGPQPYRYCWEFYSPDGSASEECRNCVVFRSRARRCYEMRGVPEQFGNLKLHCQSDCNECEYYEVVHGQDTTVLVVTGNEFLRKSLKSEAETGDIMVRFVANEYECSALLSSFRPDYVVLDCGVGSRRTKSLCQYLAGDERIPFSKIILTSHRKNVSDCFETRIFGWIKKPFTFTQLRCCLGQAE